MSGAMSIHVMFVMWAVYCSLYIRSLIELHVIVAMPLVKVRDCITGAGVFVLVVTATVNELVALIAGEPLSVTIVTKVFVLGAWAGVGAQEMRPLAEMLALVTGPAALLTDKV